MYLSLYYALSFGLTGLGGLLLGSALRPYEPVVGGQGAAFGLVAVNLIELFQSWHLVAKPALPILKMVGYCCLFLVAGLMPEVSSVVIG